MPASLDSNLFRLVLETMPIGLYAVIAKEKSFYGVPELSASLDT
jgi:hypothetical protein